MELVNWFKSERENGLSGRLRGAALMSSDRAESSRRRAADTLTPCKHLREEPAASSAQSSIKNDAVMSSRVMFVP